MLREKVPSQARKQVFVSMGVSGNVSRSFALGGSSSKHSSTGAAMEMTSYLAENYGRKIYRRLQVQIVHRHGDRSPITSLKDEDYWERQLIPETTLEKIACNTVLISDGETNTHKANGRGPFGKLTKLGLQQMIDLGTILRNELSSGASSNEEQTITDEVGDTMYPHIWTPDRPLHPSNVRVLSTGFERAVQSAQGVLHGLFPNGSYDEAKVEIDARHTTLLLPDPQPRQTKEQEILEDELAVRPHLQQREQELLPLAIRVTKALHPLLAADAREATFGAKQARTTFGSESSIENEPLAWNQLGEISKCLACRKLLPAGMSYRDHEVVVQHAAWRWFETFRHPRLAYLSMNDMCSRMVDSCKNHGSEPPMTLYSAHDSTLIGLLCAFKLEQPAIWPEYGSYIMMELLEVTDCNNSTMLPSSNNLYIRFSMNGEILESHWEKERCEMISLRILEQKLREEDNATKCMTN